MKKSVFLVALLLIAVVFVNVPSVKAGWLSGWNYRKSHEIANATRAGTNYQVSLNVYAGSGSDSADKAYLNSKCLDFPNDITFTDNDETTELDHWLQDSNASWAYFWIEIADDLSENNATIYIYYGKSGQSSSSNGFNTFVLFDDFEDNDISDWTTSGDESAISVANGEVTIDDPTQLTWIYKSISVSSYKAYCRFQTSASGYAFFTLQNGGLGSSYYNSIIGYGDTNTGEKIGWNNGNWFVTGCPTATYGEYHEGIIYANDTNIDTMTFDVDETKGINADFRNLFASVDRVCFAHGATTSITTKWDEMFVAKYVYPEPQHGDWGSEESTSEKYVTFYNTTGGILRVNNVTIANGTETKYLNHTVIELVAIVEGNDTYTFSNFTYDGSYNYSNPFSWNVTYGANNLTLWCYFRESNFTIVNGTSEVSHDLEYAVLAVFCGAPLLIVVFFVFVRGLQRKHEEEHGVYYYA